MRAWLLRGSDAAPRVTLALDPIFEAVLCADTAPLRRLLAASPEAVHARATSDRLVSSVPHWLYVGDTALHLAAAALQLPAVVALLEAGAQATAANRRGATPLHYACDPRPRSGRTWDPPTQQSIVTLLVEHGASVHHADRGGATALHRAVRARSPAAVSRLLEHGADPNAPLGTRGSTPLHLAVQPSGASGTRAALAEQHAIVAVLLQHGAHPSLPDARGKTAEDSATSDRMRAALRPTN